MRRWRGLKLRRGAFWRGAESSPVPAVPPPQMIRPAGSLRTPARLLPSGRRTWGPGWGQANQGAAWPSWIRQPRTAERRGLRLARQRGRFYEPPWFPPPPVAPPQFLRPAGQLRFGARLLPSRRRRWDPGWGQGTLGQAWPSWIRQAGPLRFGARPVTSRGRRYDPAWPQGNQGAAWPSQLRQAGTKHRPPGRPPRGHFIAVPVIFVAPPVAQQGTVTISNVLAGSVTIVNNL